MKFGGSSLQDITNLQKVCEIIVSTQASYMDKDTDRIAVVCSAMGKSTNTLIATLKSVEETGVVEFQKLKDYHYEMFEGIWRLYLEAGQTPGGDKAGTMNLTGRTSKPTIDEALCATPSPTNADGSTGAGSATAEEFTMSVDVPS